MYNSKTESNLLILGVEVFFSEGHCSEALWLLLSGHPVILVTGYPDLFFNITTN